MRWHISDNEQCRSRTIEDLEGVIRSSAMRIFTTLDEILTAAAAGDDIRRYLLSRSIATIGTFALVAKDEEELDRNIVSPLLAGWGSGASAIMVHESEKPIAKAVLLHVWSLARTSWARSMQAASTPTPATSTTTAPTHASSTSDTKVLKQLPAGKWTELVEHYNGITVGGRPRQFPIPENCWGPRRSSHDYTMRDITVTSTPHYNWVSYYKRGRSQPPER